MKNNEHNIDEIDLLENKLSERLQAYKDFRSSKNNESFFSDLHYRAMQKMDEGNGSKSFLFNPTIGYSILILIVSLFSFQFIDINNEVAFEDEYYLFSETSTWIEEEMYISDFNDAKLELDYTEYLSSEFNNFGSEFINDEIFQLAENNMDDIYNTIKNKKIL